MFKVDADGMFMKDVVATPITSGINVSMVTPLIERPAASSVAELMR